ncbi:MAG: Nif3-like dinuclear metal center hexameric protein [bacterium]|nr:Nif3-like dinuclear metal center hexameric protein [bacterium]
MPELCKVSDVVLALDRITGGRVVTETADLFSGTNRFVVTKSSGIPGKAVTETPGLVFGDPAQAVRRLAVSMTLTESQLELAGATGIDAIVAHHPVADAANSGGVPLKSYVSLYSIAILELHEAFHGLHPGLPFIHGHRSFRVDVAYGGIPGNVMYVGTALEGVSTAGDVLTRLESFGGFDVEHALLQQERELRGNDNIQETNAATGACILNGSPASPVKTILHIFPHTGFSVAHLEQALQEHPEIDTVVASISRVRPGHPLVEKANERGLTFVLGNTHALEILENGMPLAVALEALLPGVEVLLLRERATLVPLVAAGTPAIRTYARDIAERFLIPDRS